MITIAQQTTTIFFRKSDSEDSPKPSQGICNDNNENGNSGNPIICKTLYGF